jgi:hypothetical protein
LYRIIIIIIIIIITATTERVPPDANVYSVGSVLLFLWWSLLISAGSPGVLAEVFRGFTQPVQGNAWVASRLGQDRFPPNPFQFVYHPAL